MALYYNLIVGPDMELEVKKLSARGIFAGSFKFDYLPADKLCLLPLSEIQLPVKVYGEYEIYDDDSVGVTLTVDFTVTGQCSYCLSDAEENISFTSDILFVPENDDDNYFYDGIKINLETAVKDAILISQPSVLLCKKDCKGIGVPK